MSDPPGFPVPSGFTPSKVRPRSYCVDQRCRLEGPTHLHEPFGRRRLTAEDERFVEAVAAQLEYLATIDLGYC